MRIITLNELGAAQAIRNPAKDVADLRAHEDEDGHDDDHDKHQNAAHSRLA